MAPFDVAHLQEYLGYFWVFLRIRQYAIQIAGIDFCLDVFEVNGHIYAALFTGFDTLAHAFKHPH